MKVILRSILVFVLLFAGYNFVLGRLPEHWKAGGRAGSQYEQNLMRTQDYLALPSPPPVVIVGTSVSSRLEALPPEWFNLAFSGGSTFTGLEILARSDETPRVVMIETNVLVTRGLDAPMVDAAFNPMLKSARRSMPALLENHKPQHVLLRAADPTSRHGFTLRPPGRSPGLGTPSNEPEPETPPGMTDAFHQELVRRQIAHESRPAESWRLDQIEAELKKYAALLESRGATVVFFEVPQHPDVMMQPGMTSVRERLSAAFPTSRYRWIPAVDPKDYRTTDGVHLTTPGTLRYGRILADYVASLK